jgi:tetratricopeptide (TPR) repeat protein
MNLTKARNLFFIALFNLLLLVFIEIILLLFGVGIKTSLLYRTKIENQEHLYFNEYFTSQYFSTTNVTIPAANPHLFTTRKPDETYRIYVIGESTSRGFPYSKTESFPYQLGQMLNGAKAHKNFEIINFSMDATNSFIGYDIAKQAINHTPDLAIIYYGHNEFIGIGGTGTYHTAIFQINKFLGRFRTYQLLKSIASKFSKPDSRAILERMAGKQRIEFASDAYNTTMNDFHSNYEKIVTLFKDKGVEVIACGVAKNLKDFKPSNSYNIQKEDIQNIVDIIDHTDRAHLAGSFDRMVASKPNISYAIGKVLLSKGERELAAKYLVEACDNDNLRLRASSGINRVIKEIATQKGCIYIDFQEYLNNIDPDGIAGNDLILEHVHPTLKCHTAIAGKLADEITTAIFKMPQGEEYKHIPLHHSIVDSIAVTKILTNLYTKFPLSNLNYFNKTGFEGIYTFNTNSLQGMVFKDDRIKSQYNILENIFSQCTKIDEVHLKYGVYLQSVKMYNAAYQEFHLAYRQNPLNVFALNNMAIIRFQTGDKVNALKMQQKVVSQEPGFIAGISNLWLMYKIENRASDARKFEKTLRKKGVDLKTLQTFTLQEI